MAKHPHLPGHPETEGEGFEALIALARYLRSGEGCPWDRERSAKEFGDFVLEEAKELEEAFGRNDHAHTEEEWGDTLFCLMAAAAAAEEEGWFTLENALKRTHDKMVRRHDHIFGERKAETVEEITAMWNVIKAEEKKK
jgi:tetrapyrrole methylase family protein/MazG family protein